MESARRETIEEDTSNGTCVRRLKTIPLDVDELRLCALGVGNFDTTRCGENSVPESRHGMYVFFHWYPEEATYYDWGQHFCEELIENRDRATGRAQQRSEISRHSNHKHLLVQWKQHRRERASVLPGGWEVRKRGKSISYVNKETGWRQLVKPKPHEMTNAAVHKKIIRCTVLLWFPLVPLMVGVCECILKGFVVMAALHLIRKITH